MAVSNDETARFLATVEADRHYYQEILSRMPVGLSIVAEDLTIVFANGCFRKQFDLAANNGSPRRWDDVPRLRPLDTALRDVFRNDEPQRNLSLEDGARRYQISIQPLHSRHHSPNRDALVVADDLGTPEPASAWNELNAILWELDVEDWRFLDVNRQAEELLGYPRDQWLTTPATLAHIHPEDREWVESTYRAAIHEPGHSTCEYRAITVDGRVLWLQDFLRSTPAGDAPAKLRGVTVDISEHQQREEKYRSAMKLDVFSQLAGGVTEELQQAIDTIARRGEQMLEKVPPDAPVREDLVEILVATSRVAVLRNKFLKLARGPNPAPPGANGRRYRPRTSRRIPS